MIEKTETLAMRVVEAMLLDDQATASLGMRVLNVSAGEAIVEMRVRADMLNGHGSCHGGFIFALADSAFAFACNSQNQRTVAAGCQIDYLLSAFESDVLCATAVERSAGKRLGVYDVIVINQSGETVALFRGKSCRITGTVVEDVTEAA